MQFNSIIQQCRDLFFAKFQDYGTSWRIMRPSSFTDQVYIKAKRIRSIQEKGVARVGESQETEFVAIVNYCVMALVQIDCTDTSLHLPVDYLETLYDNAIKNCLSLHENKNHDYDAAWRKMRVSSITDIILMKILRTKRLEDLPNKPKVSEGIPANYMDILNYAIFALALLNEKHND